MKKAFLFLLLLIIITSGCSVHNYTLGISEEEFKKHDKWLTQLVEKSAELTIYRKTDGIGRELYYYFVDGKLIRIDEGAPKQTVVIEHVQRPR
nr:hypothetical protein [uncultured Mucilaginibacter sp.]